LNQEHLVKMVNEIAVFFDGQDGGRTAVAEILGHLRRFWDPRMRREIADYVERGGSGLRPSAWEAVRQLAVRGLHSDLS